MDAVAPEHVRSALAPPVVPVEQDRVRVPPDARRDRSVVRGLPAAGHAQVDEHDALYPLKDLHDAVEVARGERAVRAEVDDDDVPEPVLVPQAPQQ